MEAGKEKVKKICELLRKETLEPAREEADKILSEARERARELIEKARGECEAMLQQTRRTIEREKEIFHTSLNQGARQALEFLKQEIEQKLFSDQLKALVKGQMGDPAVLAELTSAVVKAIEKEGTDADLSVLVPEAVPAEKVNTLLVRSIVERLKGKSVELAPIGGGIQVKLIDDHVMIDLSDETLKELLANYTRKDFRKMIFAS